MNLFGFHITRSKKVQTTAAPTLVNREPSPRNVGQRMFATAQTSRLTADWGISITSADAEIYQSAIATRSRMCQMERDDDYFRGMLTLLENNIIGDSGIRLRPKVRLPNGKLDKDLNSAISEAWHEALEADNCTVMRNMDGIELQRLAIRSVARQGPILFRKRRPFKNAFSFALEPIEVDRLDHWWNRPAVGTNNQIKFGIELDEFNAHVAYWILTRHPGEIFANSGSTRYRERVPADEIIYVGTIERAGQTIAMPLWPSIAKRLHNLWGYEESEQIAARAGSCKGGWFKRDPKSAGADEYTGPQDDLGNHLVDTQPGQWEELPVGFEPVINNPTHPTDQFPHFVKSQLRGAAAGSGIPYNSVAQDLESVNYSSYKAGMNDARDGFKYLQGLMMRKLMRPWFRDWLKYAVLSGKIPGLEITGVDQVKRSDRWKPRRWAGLEPLKEVQANVLAVEAGFDSRRNIIEEDYDRDIEEVDDEQEHDNESAKEHKLDFSGDPHKPVVGAGNADTATGPEAEPKRNGHTNGNGHTKEFDLGLWRNLRPESPLTVNVENKPGAGKRVLKFIRDDNGSMTGAEIEEK